MPNRTFEEYFGNRAQLSGPQSAAGDEELVLRSGTVWRAQRQDIKASALISENATLTTITGVGGWVQVENWSLLSTTAAMTFANNAFSYVGVSQVVPTSIRFAASVTATDCTVELGIYVNDVQVGNGMRVWCDGQGSPDRRSFVSCEIQRTLALGDIITVKLRNRTNTNDVLVVSGQFNVG